MPAPPFVDFIEKFKRDHGIELAFAPEAEETIRHHAESKNVQVFSAIEKLMAGAPALNYMDFKGVYTVTQEALDDPKYFDKMYVEWHKKTHGKNPAFTSDGEVLP